MSLHENVVETVDTTTESNVFQEGFIDHIVSPLACHNVEELRLFISVQRPWIIEQRKEAMSIKFLTFLLCCSPFFIIIRGLLIQINISVERIVVEFSLLYLVSSWLKLVCLVKDVHNLNCVHDLVLGEVVAHDNDGDVVLELLNDVCEFFSWNAFGQETDKESLITLIWVLA